LKPISPTTNFDCTWSNHSLNYSWSRPWAWASPSQRWNKS